MRTLTDAYRRFGTTYRSHLQGSGSPKWDRKTVTKRRQLTPSLRHQTFQATENIAQIRRGGGALSNLVRKKLRVQHDKCDTTPQHYTHTTTHHRTPNSTAQHSTLHTTHTPQHTYYTTLHRTPNTTAQHTTHIHTHQTAQHTTTHRSTHSCSCVPTSALPNRPHLDTPQDHSK